MHCTPCIAAAAATDGDDNDDDAAAAFSNNSSFLSVFHLGLIRLFILCG